MFRDPGMPMTEFFCRTEERTYFRNSLDWCAARRKAEEPMPTRLEELCVQKGLKMTEQRRVISRVLSEATDHPDVEQVYRRAVEIDPKISIATVYRTVRLFEEANVIERLDFGDGRSRFEENREEHHHHL